VAKHLIDTTIANDQVLVERGEHTGALQAAA
jgi:hypothetical protein